MHRTPDKTALEIMRKTAKLNYTRGRLRAIGKQRLVAREIIDHQMTLPTREEILRVTSRTASLVIKHYNRRSGLKYITSVRPQIRSMSFALARIQLRYRGFGGWPRAIGMQYVAFEQ